MNISKHYVNDYRRLVSHLFATLPPERARSEAVGGNFDAMGALEKNLLVHFGLKPEHALIDIGCGSGRLARKLASYLVSGTYTGIDVVPELIECARSEAPPSWDFIVIDDISALQPVAEMADFICFFSVFTHLLPEESYAYLEMARKALRPGGRIVFSFLEYDCHWRIFEQSVQAVEESRPLAHLNTFFSRDMIRIWCARLGLEIVEIRGGDEKAVPLAEPVTFDDGSVSSGFASFGQSFAVLAAA